LKRLVKNISALYDALDGRRATNNKATSADYCLDEGEKTT